MFSAFPHNNPGSITLYLFHKLTPLVCLIFFIGKSIDVSSGFEDLITVLINYRDNFIYLYTQCIYLQVINWITLFLQIFIKQLHGDL